MTQNAFDLYLKEESLLKTKENILSCTEAGGILNLTKMQVRELVEQGKLTNYGNEHRYMVSEKEVQQLREEA